MLVEFVGKPGSGKTYNFETLKKLPSSLRFLSNRRRLVEAFKVYVRNMFPGALQNDAERQIWLLCQKHIPDPKKARRRAAHLIARHRLAKNLQASSITTVTDELFFHSLCGLIGSDPEESDLAVVAHLFRLTYSKERVIFLNFVVANEFLLDRLKNRPAHSNTRYGRFTSEEVFRDLLHSRTYQQLLDLAKKEFGASVVNVTSTTNISIVIDQLQQQGYLTHR